MAKEGKKERIFNLTEGQLDDLIEKTITEVLQEIRTGEQGQEDYFSLSEEERKGREEAFGFCGIEDVDGEGSVFFSKAIEKDTERVNSIAIQMLFSDEEYNDNVLLFELSDIRKVVDFLNKILEEENL